MKNLLIVFAFIVAFLTTNAQKKYAILIGGNYGPNLSIIPATDRWNAGENIGPYGYDEFWNDTYLMWEVLIKEEGGKGYSDEDVFVLFANGNDFTFYGQDNRYKAIHNGYPHVTDYSATEQEVSNVFTSLANTITENDFLFVWIMSHGGDNNPTSENNGNAYLYLYDYPNTGDYDGLLYDDELNNYLDYIPAYKKVVFIQAPHSGRFAKKLAEDNTIIFTSSDKGESSYQADDYPETENETIGVNKYNHGEFNFHLYSSLAGETPVEDNTIYNNQSLITAPDINEDNNKSFSDIVQWEILNNSLSTENSIISGDIWLREHSSLDYPTVLYDSEQLPKNYVGIIGVTKQCFIWYLMDISFSNAFIYLTNFESAFILNESSKLIFNENVILYATKSTNKIKLYEYSEIIFNSQTIFKHIENEYWMGIHLYENVSLSLSGLFLYDGTLNCSLSSDLNNEIEIASCYFERSTIMGKYDDIHLSQSSFKNSTLYVSGTEDGILFIDGCDFNGPNFYYPAYNNGIDINSFPDYEILNCNIQGFNDGIRISNCSSIPFKDFVSYNSIHNNTNAGIRVINSSAEIYNNVGIYDNNQGIVSSNYSKVKIIGSESAIHVSETQRICNNIVNQIYGSYNSFPYLKWNAIWSDNNSNCLVKWDLQIFANQQNISNNFWGPPSMFDPNVDFCPTIAFKWLPIWNLQYGPPPKENDELLYDAAVLNSEQGNYSEAEYGYKQVIEFYPQSNFAEASLKNLFPLAKYLNYSYHELKMFLQNDTNIVNNQYLNKIGNYLSAWCDVETENFPLAIEYFENIIDSPLCFQDSIFAIIDLGYIYFLMENGFKSSYTGSHSEYKFETREDYEINKNYLLTLCDEFSNTEIIIKQNISDLKSGELLQNVPNPFCNSTQFWYKLIDKSSVSINVFDYTGKRVSTINPGEKEKGSHFVEFSSVGLPAGIYFYSLKINGIMSDSKKMTVMK